jgi:hypothetical protein
MSPVCGISRERLLNILLQIDKIVRSGGDVSYHVTLLSDREEEVKLASFLICANEQQKFAPFFLYASRSVIDRKPLPLDLLLSTLNIDTRSFKSCIADSAKITSVLKHNDDFFFSKGLTGVPSVVVGSRGFSLIDAESIIEALNEDLAK